MSLVSGPGKGGARNSEPGHPTELVLVIEKHVEYIRSLDTVSMRPVDVHRTGPRLIR